MVQSKVLFFGFYLCWLRLRFMNHRKITIQMAVLGCLVTQVTVDLALTSTTLIVPCLPHHIKTATAQSEVQVPERLFLT